MKRNRLLKIVLGSVFLIILVYNFKTAYNLKYEASGDAWDYVHLGLTLAKTNKYGHLNTSKEILLEDFKMDRIKTESYTFNDKTAFRPPVWPVIISLIFLTFGYKLLNILLFKYFLHIVGVFIFYKTLKLLKLREVVIILTTFLYGISPAWQLYSRVFLSEPITLFFITTWLYLLIRFIKGKSSFLPQSLTGGIIILTHPYYIFLPFSVWFVMYLRKIMKLKLFIASSFICASIVSIWIMRNIVTFNVNELVLTTSSGAVMAKGWNPKVLEAHTNTKGDLADEELVLRDYTYDRNKKYNEMERMQLYKNATLHFIRSYPDMILPVIGTKILSAFNPFPETPKPGILETGRWTFQFLALTSLFYLILFSNNKLFQSLAIGLILATIGITIVTYSGFRFRMPQVGLELLFLGFVLNDILEKRKIQDIN